MFDHEELPDYLHDLRENPDPILADERNEVVDPSLDNDDDPFFWRRQLATVTLAAIFLLTLVLLFGIFAL